MSEIPTPGEVELDRARRVAWAKFYDANRTLEATKATLAITNEDLWNLRDDAARALGILDAAWDGDGYGLDEEQRRRLIVDASNVLTARLGRLIATDEKLLRLRRACGSDALDRLTAPPPPTAEEARQRVREEARAARYRATAAPTT